MGEVSRGELDELRRRLESCEERLHHGDTTLALLDQRLRQIDNKLSELSVFVQALRDRPARHWDTVVSLALQWAVTLLLGYVALKLKLS